MSWFETLPAAANVRLVTDTLSVGVAVFPVELALTRPTSWTPRGPVRQLVSSSCREPDARHAARVDSSDVQVFVAVLDVVPGGE